MATLGMGAAQGCGARGRTSSLPDPAWNRTDSEDCGAREPLPANLYADAEVLSGFGEQAVLGQAHCGSTSLGKSPHSEDPRIPR